MSDGFYAILLLVTLASTAIGLGFSISSVVNALREKSAIRGLRGAATEVDQLETRRNLVQQSLRTLKLILLSLVVLFAIIEWPPEMEPRTWVLRLLLIAVVLMISGAAVHEKFANKKIIDAVVRERVARNMKAL